MSTTNTSPALRRLSVFVTFPVALVLAYLLIRLILSWILAPLVETSSPEDIMGHWTQLVCTLLVGIWLTLKMRRSVASLIDRFGFPGLHEPTPLTIIPPTVRVGLTVLLKRKGRSEWKEVIGVHADAQLIENFFTDRATRRLELTNSNRDVMILEKPALVAFDNSHDRATFVIKFIREGKVRFVLEPCQTDSAVFSSDNQNSKATIQYRLAFVGASPDRVVGSLNVFGKSRIMRRIFVS
ncbi:MAG: hypothetical protein KC777_26145 [Cyanobacteria bacterium HKST-UBA02]|nr:hypothetical protein [Cyanobacteria bacterium HKST-UBA02]